MSNTKTGLRNFLIKIYKYFAHNIKPVFMFRRVFIGDIKNRLLNQVSGFLSVKWLLSNNAYCFKHLFFGN